MAIIAKRRLVNFTPLQICRGDEDQIFELLVFNLNIPRYVDTFDAEEAVDLDEVAAKLFSFEKEMGETNKIIAGFCAELGIKVPF